MEQWEKNQKANEVKRKAAAISNRKRLKAETVEAIDNLLKVAGSIHWDAVEGLSYGHLTLSFTDLVELKNQADKVAKEFKLEGDQI